MARAAIVSLVTASALLVLAGCANVDFARAAHDALQQHSCAEREARGSCQRGWDAEYETWQAQLAQYRESLEQAEDGHPATWQAGDRLQSSLVIRDR